MGAPFGKNLELPKGLGYVALQAPELVNPRMASPGPTEARAAREGASLARHLQGRSLHFVGYSFGGHFAVATRCALVCRADFLLRKCTLLRTIHVVAAASTLPRTIRVVAAASILRSRRTLGSHRRR